MAYFLTPDKGSIAVLDIGSNSFHMVIARVEHSEIRTFQRFREKVRLGEGLTENESLTDAAQKRALECLKQFGQRLQGMPASSVAAFGTNALRVAGNSRSFLKRAKEALGYPIEIISGVEEARLIYLGVAHTLPSDPDNRLVIDIGGGSTELIIGNQFQPLLMESLEMGCVTYMDRFFPDGQLSKKAFRKAELHAAGELITLRRYYRKKGWTKSYGASGSIKAIASACQEITGKEEVDRDALKALKKKLLEFRMVSEVELPGISASRRENVVAAVAILTAALDLLEIEALLYSDGSLRDGALYDLLGRSEHEDVRLRSVQSMQHRFNIDLEQADRVAGCVTELFRQVTDQWGISANERHWLYWAAQLHEIGLAVSHVRFHKHGEYLLNHADLPGFTRLEQQYLAFLVRAHRRRFPTELLNEFPADIQERLLQLAVILRFATLLHRSRGDSPAPQFQLQTKGGNSLIATLVNKNYADFPLTESELTNESERLAKVGFKLKLS